MSDDLKQVGHGLRAGYEPGGNLVIECLWPESLIRGARVIVQRADVPDLLRTIMGGEDYERTVAPRLLANLKAIREGQERAAEPATWVASGCAGGPPAGLASPAAVEMAGAPPTRAGALHDAMLSATARQAGIRSASIDPGAPAVDFSRFDPRIDKNRGGTCSCGHGATAHADLRDGVSRCGDCGCHLFVADHAGLTSPEMRAVNAARKAPLVAEMEAAIGQGNQDPPAPSDPAALLRAAIAQQVRRSACDPAGLLTLAQALESVNRAGPPPSDDCEQRRRLALAATQAEAARDEWRVKYQSAGAIIRKVMTLRDVWRGMVSAKDQCAADLLDSALRGEDPSDG